MSGPADKNQPGSRAPTWADERIERIIGNLLRIGAIVSALIVVAGGILFLARDGLAPAPNYQEFKEEPAEFRSPWGVVQKAASFDSRGLIMLGLLLLIATPLARVVFSVYAFIRQRDYTYVLVTAIVLAVLLYSLFSAYLS